jgi:indolepyruvate ferredoxin oxidoreductase
MSDKKVLPEDKYTSQDGPVFLSGNQAFIRLVFEQSRRDREAGLNTGGFISGYRGSPFGNFDAEVHKVDGALTARDIHFNPGVNEAMAATAVWGSQQVEIHGSSTHDGAFGLWYGKGPGVDQAADALHHANLWGTSKYGGVVMAVGDDPMSRSSSIQQQSEFALASFGIPVFHASSVQDIYDYGLIAYQLSRFAGVWTAVKSVSDIAESWYMVDVDPARTHVVQPDDFDMPEMGVHTRWPDSSVDQDERLARARMPAVHAFVKANRLNRVTLDSAKRRFGIITSGKSYLDTLEALEDLGIGDKERDEIGLAIFKVGLIWPLERSSVREFAESVDEVMLMEEGRPFLEQQVKDALYDMPAQMRPLIHAKQMQGDQLFPAYGELNPNMIARALCRWLEPTITLPSMDKWLAVLDNNDQQLAVARAKVERTPYFCSGCPHNTSTKQPDGSTQLVGIGCHYLVRLMDRGGVTYTQMGGEGATWAGASAFVDHDHAFINLGDGTYYHSGSTAVRQSIAAGVNITYKILYNDAVAMTGGQPHDGPLSPQTISRQMAAEGAAKVVVVSDDPGKFSLADFAAGTELFHRDQLQTVMKDLQKIKGVTVLIYEQTCATELRRRRKRGIAEDPAKRTYINHRVCEGCGDCGEKSNCLSVQPLETELGRKRVIDQSACNKDFSCVKGFCPSFVTIEGGELARGKGVTTDEDLFATLPEPMVESADKVYGALVCGIGGTGVVTISSLLGEAAKAEGKVSQVLDLTGMAQKFGAVYCHLKIGTRIEDLNSTRLSVGKANLLIGADIVTSASDEGLARVREGHTHAVINSHETVTGQFTRDGDFHIPVSELRQAIDRVAGGQADFFDSTDIATRLTGDSIGANVMLLGYACQKGYLPVQRASLEQAISNNGVAVAYNLRAFSLGRLLAHQPEKIEELMTQGSPTPQWSLLSESVDQLIERRYQDLVKYQNKAYADEYLAFVKEVQSAESQVSESSELTEAAARYLYKLMALKDEYEVARLYTDGSWLRSIEDQFTGDYKIKFHMAPPLLSRRDPESGELIKREFGPWMYHALKLAAKFKFLRGGPLDIFGYSQERKAERTLVQDYRDVTRQALSCLSPDNHATAVDIASVPEHIRGYGHVKEENMIAARKSWDWLIRELENPRLRGTDPVKIVEPVAA